MEGQQSEETPRVLAKQCHSRAEISLEAVPGRERCQRSAILSSLGHLEERTGMLVESRPENSQGQPIPCGHRADNDIPPPIPAGHSPLSHIGTGDGLGRHFPGTVDAPSRQAFEVKLAADLGVRATGVGHIVTIEGHHVAENVCAGIRIWGGKDSQETWPSLIPTGAGA